MVKYKQVGITDEGVPIFEKIDNPDRTSPPIPLMTAIVVLITAIVGLISALLPIGKGGEPLLCSINTSIIQGAFICDSENVNLQVSDSDQMATSVAQTLTAIAPTPPPIEPTAIVINVTNTPTATLTLAPTSTATSTFTPTPQVADGVGIYDPNCRKIVDWLNKIEIFDDSLLDTVITNVESGQKLESETCSTLFRLTDNGHEVVIHPGQAAIGWTAFTADLYPNGSTSDRIVQMDGYNAIRIIPNDYTLASNWLMGAKSQNVVMIDGDLVPR